MSIPDQIAALERILRHHKEELIPSLRSLAAGSSVAAISRTALRSLEREAEAVELAIVRLKRELA